MSKNAGTSTNDRINKNGKYMAKIIENIQLQIYIHNARSHQTNENF